MPHKHTRKARDRDDTTYDLPPTSLARPLPVSYKSRSAIGKTNLKSNSKAKTKPKKTPQFPQDDTPKAFARIMHYQNTGRKPHGLDNGDSVPGAKKPKQEATASSSLAPPSASHSKGKDSLQIEPGETISDFSARVNQALPISGLARTAKQLRDAGLGDTIKERQTKREKRIQKMQAEWRREEAKRKEREEEAQDEAVVQEEEIWGVESQMNKKNRGGGGGTGEDPWADLKWKREQRKGLHDVVQAPPQLTKTPKELLKIRNGAAVDVANVPAAAGSLKRREELGSARREVIQRYRAMMQQKREV